MKTKWKRWLRPVLFTLGGVLAGLAYDRFVGCAGGVCPLTATPARSMISMGVMGWALSGLFQKDCGSCRS